MRFIQTHTGNSTCFFNFVNINAHFFVHSSLLCIIAAYRPLWLGIRSLQRKNKATSDVAVPKIKIIRVDFPELCCFKTQDEALCDTNLLNAATLNPTVAVQTADNTILGHDSNIMLTEGGKKKEGCWRVGGGEGLACQIPQLHNSVGRA